MAKTDRRVQRTRERLQRALIELISERGYDAITVQDIVNRANVGRTTFYLHYSSKDELFMSCHEAVVSKFRLCPLSREDLLSPEAPPEMVSAYRHLEDARALLSPIFLSYVKDSPLILRRIHDRCARQIEACLRTAFAEGAITIPLDVLANYLTGAQIALVQWWLEEHRPYTPEDLAQAIHHLQRAAIREAFNLRDSNQASRCFAERAGG
ncbi:putative HTH-type transcriptional regulator YvdT [bacterium HR26]|nr:putative HTH-type transcriptional regulator YvdT [bacterium HR26]